MASGAKTVLLINELGAGYGHVEPLLRVGTALADRGCRIICAMNDVVRPGLLLRRIGFPVVQAPIWPGHRIEKGVGYGDLLTLQGFESVPALRLMTGAWQDLFDLVAPDLIVADHSPTAALTAYRTIPTVLIGNGFAMPPPDLPDFPPLSSDGEPIGSEARLLEVVTEVQAHRGKAAPPTLPSLFAADYRGVLTLPELDPYGDCRSEDVLGRIESLPDYTPRSAGRSIYAYIGTEHPDIHDIVAGLCTADAALTCHVRGDPGAFASMLEKSGATVLAEPADLSQALPACAAVVGYASTGLAHAALAAGRPQLALPYDLEKGATAALLDRLGLARTVPTGAGAKAITEAVEALLAERRYADHAAACAQSLLARPPTDALAAIVEACAALLA